jgi:RNA polymerase sigma-70 factor (ECF subfamily)
MNDKEIMDALMRGDEAALIAFIDRYQSKIIGFGIRQFGMSKDEAEDLAQEVIIRIWFNARNMKNNKSLSGLVNTIASNYAIDRYRRSKVANIDREADVYLSPVPDASDLSNPEAVAIRNDEKRRAEIALYRALSSINPSYADALVRAYIDGSGKTLGTVAMTMGINAMTLKSRVFRARAAARKALEGIHGKDRADYSTS